MIAVEDQARDHPYRHGSDEQLAQEAFKPSYAPPLARAP